MGNRKLTYGAQVPRRSSSSGGGGTWGLVGPRRVMWVDPGRLRLIPPSCKVPRVAPFPGKLTQGPAVIIG